MGHNVNGDHSRRNFLCTTSNQNIVNIQQFKSCTEGINPFLKLQKYYFDLNLINSMPISSSLTNVLNIILILIFRISNTDLQMIS